MRYWWVNQNQTFRHEVPGGFLWSPKRRADGRTHASYETMREVAPGDVVLSFAERCIKAFGIARSYAYEAPKPEEFGSAGRNWDLIGWRVDVAFQEIPTRFRPSEWMARLTPLLPPRHSPLRRNGHGVQNIYLAELPAPLALELGGLIGHGLDALMRFEAPAARILSDSAAPAPELVLWEEHLRRRVELDEALSATEKEAIVLARRGQGLFKQRVQQVESCCRVTRVDRAEHLRASHCKPWRDATNAERLCGENGLLLTPTIDHLFDRGFISFRDDGRLLVSPVADRPSLLRMGVAVDRDVDVGSFTRGQQRFLEFHRDQVFLASRRGHSR